MEVRVAIPCVDYSDFLRLTLKRTLLHFNSVTILTSPSDKDTLEIAKKYNTKTLITNAWYYRKGDKFNKAAALNEWLDSQPKNNPDLWLLSLDTDILLPTKPFLDLSSLNPKGLYSVIRRMCENLDEWNKFVQGEISIDKFPLCNPFVKDNKVWGVLPTSNPAAVCGYFQLWNPLQAEGTKRFKEYTGASGYDVDFALLFPEQVRANIPDVEVLHVGNGGVNWEGRTSTKWINTKIPN